MSIIFIQEADKPITWLEKIKQKCNRIETQELEGNGQKKMCLKIPNWEDRHLNEKLQKRITKQDKIVLSKTAQKYKIGLFFPQNQIITGKKIMSYLLEDIILYVIKHMVEGEEVPTLAEQNLYFLTSRYGKENIKIMEYFLEKVRTINIITNDIKAYRVWEENIFEEKGILMTVSHHTKKSLKKAKWIINLDMTEEEVKTYQINRKGIIILLNQEKFEPMKGFDGIYINNLELKKKEVDEVYYDYEAIQIYESNYQEESDYEANVKKIREDGREIANLVGNSGIIDNQELKTSKIFLTNE